MEHKIYNPAAQPKEWLIQHFVVRTKVFEKIFKDIKDDPMKYPPQHYLIQGQRGMGKTTLLLRLKYEIENSAELNQWLIPVFFNEEVYDLTTLSNLWEKLLKYLDSLWDTGGTYYKKTDAFIGDSDYEKKCFELLSGILKEKDKKLIIFFDNFGQLFLDNLNEKGHRRLREVLMQCNDIRIVGASAIVLQDLHDYSKPFFEFFKIINLEGLNKDETFQLITKLQENDANKIDLKKNKAKIETLAILTSGVIRTIMLIYEVILNDQDGSALRDLESILDRITPLYKHRMEDLPPQQRKIIDVIAKSWDAISTKEIAQNIRENGQPMATKLISAQLQQLEKNNVIDKKQTNTKNHLYQLKERFFNIWYLMRNGDRMDRCRVIWLTKFLETWYNDESELDSFIKDHIEHLRSGKYNPESALTISEALAHSNKLDIMSLDKVLKETSYILSEDQKKALPDIHKQKMITAHNFLIEEKYNESINIFISMEKLDDVENAMLAFNYIATKQEALAVDILDKIDNDNKLVTLLLGTSYFLLSKFHKAINILEKYDGPEEGKKYYIIGQCYKYLYDKQTAKQYFYKAISLGYYESYKEIINILVEESNLTEAKKYSLEAVNHGQINATKKFIDMYIQEFWNKDLSLAGQLIDMGLKFNKIDPDFYTLKGRYLTYRNKISQAYKNANHADNLFLTNKYDMSYYNINLFLLMFITIYIYADKNEAIKLSKRIILDESPKPMILYSAYIEIWNKEYEKGLDVLIGYLRKLKSFDDLSNGSDELNRIFQLLLAKKQYHSLLNIFNNNTHNLKDQFKPTYYALMYHLKDEYPNEYLKMGDELKEPVADILKEVEEMAVKYA